MSKEIFFSRQNHLEVIKKRVKGLWEGYRQNIAIIGDEMIGKTSIIFKFLDSHYDNRTITLYLEARHETISSFAKRFIGVLLYNFLSNSGITLKEDTDFLILKSAKYIPKTIAKIKSILHAVEKRKKNNIFTELLSLCDTVHEETGKYCVVIIDEFQNLEGLGIKSLYREWAKLLIAQKNTLYIITSSAKHKARSILSKDLSLLFGNFETISVDPFDIKTSGDFLESRLSGSGLDKGLKDFLVHFTGGYPFYLGLLADAVLKSQGGDFPSLLENLLFDASGALNQRFSNYIKRFQDIPNSNDYISILYLVSSGRNKIKDIAHILRKQKKEITLRVSRMIETDTLSKNGDFLKVNDRVFGFWLKFVYQEKMSSLTFNAKNQKDKFRDIITGMIKEFAEFSQRPLTERFSELFRLFEDEMFQIERKKVRLNHFREIKPFEFRNKAMKDWLICRSHDAIWVIAFKNGRLSEEDIAEFAQECKKYRSKLQQKILVTLADIDTNTRLKALEEKVWAWDINSINQLFDNFSQPRLITA